MRTIDELGTSPTPWCVDESEYGDKNNVVCNYVCDKIHKGEVRTKVVAGTNHNFKNSQADARLIASAPELYKALFDLVLYGETILDWDVAPTHIKASVMLKLKNAKNAIAKVSGEEVK